MPRDAFDAEWVEIAAEGDTPADLSGWKVDDGEGGGSPYTLPSGSIVGPHGLLVVTLPHALFNNDGDAVRLIRPDGTIADEFSYSSGTADLSFCLLDSGWLAECPPTPGAPNRPAAASTPPSGSAPQAPSADAPKAPGASDVPVVSVAAVALPRSAPGRQAMLLRIGGVDSPVYALAMPGAVYSGIDLSTPTPQSAPPVPAPHRATVAARNTEPAPARAPVAPIAGGLLLALGTIVAGYERLRPRVAIPSEAAGGDSPEDDASIP
jgi:hypothetical protein